MTGSEDRTDAVHYLTLLEWLFQLAETSIVPSYLSDDCLYSNSSAAQKQKNSVQTPSDPVLRTRRSTMTGAAALIVILSVSKNW